MTGNPVATPGNANETRWAGGLLAAGCLAVIAAIGIHLASGAPAMVGASIEETAAVLAAGATGFTLVGLLSIPANLAIILAAVMLANTRPHPTSRVPAAALWYAVAIGFIFALLYDMALPFLLVPLAASYAQHPVVFEGLYRTFDLIHSAGLLFAFLALAVLLRTEATRPTGTIPAWWSLIATLAALAGAALMASFIVGAPLVFLAPAVFVVWGTVAFVGFRMVVGRGKAGVPSADAVGV